MRATFALALALALGCGRTSQEPDGAPAPGGSGGSAGHSGPGTAGAGGGGEAPPTCDATQSVRSPLALLEDLELARTVRAVLKEPQPPRGAVEQYVRYDANVPSPAFVAEWHQQAHALALRVSQSPKQLRELAACDPLTRGEDECSEELIEHFVRRAFRRPVTEDDRAEMAAVFERGHELGGDFASGARAVIEVVLQSPELLYLVELGNGVARGDSTELTAHEVATRLSYFLTGAPPDDELAVIADSGALGADTRREQAQRLLGSEPNRRHVQSSYERWFQLRRPEAGTSTLTLEEEAAVREETQRFIDDVTFDGAGTFEALLTEPTTWLNEPAARLYGVPGVSGDAFRKVQLDPTQRGGLFTQPAFLSASSWGNRTHPFNRATAVLTGLLCQQVEPPPPVVVDPPGPVMGPTMREHFESITASPACQECHRALNGAGFPFEHYDEAGRYRDTEEGAPIVATGALWVGDAAGPVGNAVELMARLAQSETARACFVTHWLEQSRRRAAAPEDACAAAALTRQFGEGGGKVTELLLEIASSAELGLLPDRVLAPED